MVKLSIIIPVYNVEKYLDECLNSLFAQLGDDTEIILVDDGSTDKSGKKCDQWTEQSNKIKVVHKKNGGLSSARNSGLKNAKGEYILFVDSDDRIAPDSLDSLRKDIEYTAADLYFMHAIKFYPDGKTELLDERIKRESVRNKTDIEVVKYVSSLTRFPGSACTKAYRKSFLDENDLHFPFDKRIAEDLGFTLRCLLAAKSFDVVECDFYEYRQNREGSITSNSTSINKSFWDLAVFLKESIDLLTFKRQPKTEKSKYALAFVAYEYSVALVHLCRVTERTEEAYSMMRSEKWLGQYMNSRRGKVINLMLKTIGIKTTSKCLACAYLIRERFNNK